MTQHMTADVDQLDALALAFVVRVQGTWTPEAREAFEAELAHEGLTVVVPIAAPTYPWARKSASPRRLICSSRSVWRLVRQAPVPAV